LKNDGTEISFEATDDSILDFGDMPYPFNEPIDWLQGPFVIEYRAGKSEDAYQDYPIAEKCSKLESLNLNPRVF